MQLIENIKKKLQIKTCKVAQKLLYRFRLSQFNTDSVGDATGKEVKNINNEV